MCDWIEAGGTGIAQETAPDFFFGGGGKQYFRVGKSEKCSQSAPQNLHLLS